MARVPRRDITLYRGDGYTHVFDFYENSGTAKEPVQGAAIDMSDRTFAAQWRPSHNSEEAVDFIVDDTESATGRIVITLMPATVDNLNGNMKLKGWYDLQSTFISDGWVETLSHGEVLMDPDVTRIEGP